MLTTHLSLPSTNPAGTLPGNFFYPRRDRWGPRSGPLLILVALSGRVTAILGATMMAAEWSKKQRRELKELQGIAWERELATALQVLRGDFDAWERGDISAVDLSDRIHEFHNGKSRELFNRYSSSLNDFVILHAIASGVIAESELSDELHQSLSDDIEDVRKRWNSQSAD